MTALHTTSVDAERPLELVDFPPGSVPVHDKRRAGPKVSPRRRIRPIRPFRRTSLVIDDLNTRDDVRGLFLPRFIRKKSAMHENGVEFALLDGERHRLDVGPVFCAQFLKCVEITVLEDLLVAVATIFQ